MLLFIGGQDRFLLQRSLKGWCDETRQAKEELAAALLAKEEQMQQLMLHFAGTQGRVLLQRLFKCWCDEVQQAEDEPTSR